VTQLTSVSRDERYTVVGLTTIILEDSWTYDSGRGQTAIIMLREKKLDLFGYKLVYIGI
jgi:hypothetical protein